jgi:hypothetical protein
MRNGSAAAIAALAICGLAGCGVARHDTGEHASGAQGLTIAPGVTVDTGSYVVTGPSSYTSAGSVAIGDSPDVPITLSGLPLGTGYQIDVAATASDGVTTCSGSNTFDVVGDPTIVTVHLQCGVPVGTIQVDASVNVCPVLDGLNVVPLRARTGGVIALAATAHDPDSSPRGITYEWRINSALLPSHPEPTLSFTCTSAGQNVVQVTASDGDPNCNVVDTVTLNCTGP